MFSRALLGALLIATSLPAVIGGAVQKSALRLPRDAAKHRAAVKEIFLDSYNAYKTYAFGHDDVTPVSKSFSDGRNGWGATIVDALTTLYIMGEEDLFKEAVDFSSKIDFSISHTEDTVSVFETTIRYLGATLSAYELSGGRYPALIQKAQQVADKMADAWVGNNSLPFGHIDFNTSTPQIDTTNIAEAGTLSLEWYTLTKHTRNDTYRQLAEGSVRRISTLDAPLPGLAAQTIDPATGEFVDAYVTWGGGSDSYFEYLIKYARLTNTNDNLFADTWAAAIDSSIKYLTVTSTAGNHLYLGTQNDDGTLYTFSEHLACFAAGNWMLGGKLLNNATIVQYGLVLNDACWNTYAGTATGIGPELFAFYGDRGQIPSSFLGYVDGQMDFFNKTGFLNIEPYEYYYLRPEVLESNFYAWRMTGDTKYLDRAASAINSFQTYLKAPAGYAGIFSVMNTTTSDDNFIDDTESFWYAEVLKYLYLTFDDPDNFSIDEWVFNTEAHPFKAPPAKFSYGSGRPRGGVKHGSPHKPSAPRPAVSPAPLLPNNRVP